VTPQAQLRHGHTAEARNTYYRVLSLAPRVSAEARRDAPRAVLGFALTWQEAAIQCLASPLFRSHRDPLAALSTINDATHPILCAVHVLCALGCQSDKVTPLDKAAKRLTKKRAKRQVPANVTLAQVVIPPTRLVKARTNLQAWIGTELERARGAMAVLTSLLRAAARDHGGAPRSQRMLATSVASQLRQHEGEQGDATSACMVSLANWAQGMTSGPAQLVFVVACQAFLVYDVVLVSRVWVVVTIALHLTCARTIARSDT